MDQIEEKFHPVHVVVVFIDIHVMARTPPEKIANYHTLPLFLIVLAVNYAPARDKRKLRTVNQVRPLFCQSADLTPDSDALSYGDFWCMEAG
ncbi:hypothetical protein [uncultured Marinobacter sp.]|uniref:hypothetical protein n=1 Tax=uncultured Marinobacter sp. TaxID=187379 RepID=UPI0025978F6E|nr:hypothetical protein [uncultured Marinobacter sp.]